MIHRDSHEFRYDDSRAPMHDIIPLFAAGPDLGMIFTALVVFVLIIRVVGAVIAANNPGNMPPNRRPPMPPRPPQQQGGDNEALKGEIEEFLRRVSNRRDPQGKPPGQGAPGRPVPQLRTPPTIMPAERRRRAAPVVVVSNTGAPVLTEVPDSRNRGDIDEQVKRHLNIQQFEQRAEQLTSIDEKERQFDRQIQQTFAHQVGHLKPSVLSVSGDLRTVSDTAPVVIDDEKKQNNSFALLTGSNLINAVIVAEIMARPEHRW